MSRGASRQRRVLTRPPTQLCTPLDTVCWALPHIRAPVAASPPAERQKRLREDANEQYQNVEDHRQFLPDPWAEPLERGPVTDHDVDVVIVGGGIASVLTAVRLHEAGIKGSQVRVIEKAGDFGGTWVRWTEARRDLRRIYKPLTLSRSRSCRTTVLEPVPWVG